MGQPNGYSIIVFDRRRERDRWSREKGPYRHSSRSRLRAPSSHEGASDVNAPELRRRVGGLGAASSAEALFAVDGEQRIIAWNAEAGRIFGYCPETAIGEHCYEIVAACDLGGQRFCRSNCAVIRTSRLGGTPSPMRLQARSPGGQTATVEISTIVLAPEGAATAVIHLCRSLQPLAPGAAEPPRLSVTQREREVLAALCRGETTEEMARGLGLTATTVRNHVQHLLAKLAVHSRAEVVAMAYRDGLLL